MDFTPSNGDELQSEYLVPRAHAVAALEAIRALSDRIAPLLQVTEVRTIAGDDLWLSTAEGGDRVGLHFTWQPRQPEVEALLPTIEAALAPFGARPHWGKLFADDGPRPRPPVPALGRLPLTRRAHGPRRRLPQRLPGPPRPLELATSEDVRAMTLASSDAAQVTPASG